MKLPKRSMFFLYCCLLAEWFTSPPRAGANPILPSDVKALESAGLVLNNGGGWRCTEAGKAELSIAGIDTRSAAFAEASWSRRFGKDGTRT